MKKSLRVLLFAALVLTLLTISAVAVAAAPFSTGDNTYATLPEAVAAVAEGGTITMTESATFSGDIVLSANKTYTITASKSSVTLTLSSGSLRINGGNVTVSTLKLLAQANNALMVANQGTRVTVLSGTYVSEGTTVATSASVTADYSAYLQIDGGTFTGAVGTYDSSAGSLGGTSSAHTTIVINGGSFARAAKTTGTAYVLRLARQYTDITVNGGTFVYDYTAGTERSGYTVYFNTSTGSLTINGGSFTSQGVQGATVVDIQSGVLTINDGQFYALQQSVYVLKAYSGSPTVTINGGLFTFVDSLKKESDVNSASSSTYKNSIGYQFCYGVNFDCTGKLRITGGTFMGGNSYQALSIGTNTTDAVISGGSFYGHRAVSLYGRAVFTGGNFYHNPGQANAKILDVRNVNAVAYIFGGNFDGTHVSAANTSTGAVIYYEKAGTVNIYGGSFKLGGSSTSGAIIGTSTTDPISGILLTIASGSATVNGVSYTGTGAHFVKTGGGAILRGNATGMTVTVNAGTFETHGKSMGFYLTSGVTLDVKSGTFTAHDSASLFTVTAANAKLTFTRKNSVSVTTYDNAMALNLSAGTTVIHTGTFVANGSNLVNFVIPAGQGSLEIKDGTFILNDSDTVQGGAIIRAGVGVIPQEDQGQYYDPTEIYVTASGEITLNGGMFVDNRKGNTQLIDLTVGTAKVNIDGAVLLSHDLQVYFVDSYDDAYDIRMTPGTPVVQYGGVDYYCYFADLSANTAYAPTLSENAGILMSPYYDGVRFTSVIPAAIAARLPEDATFGTLIAPANYVAAAGAFTHAKLNTLASKNPTYGTTYVDIPAVYSVATLTDGSIAFSAALVNIKEANYDRVLAAVAYVKVGSTYYYSNYDAASHTGSLAAVAKAAYTDYTILPDEVHMTPSVYRNNCFSAYELEEQQVLKSYCGYEHTFDVERVTPSTEITVGEDASASLATAAKTTLKNTLTTRGYTATGAVILVGNTGTAETAKALSEIEGDGYYIGVINGKIVIVGTTNALTMQALSVFSSEVLSDTESDGSIILAERVVSYVEMIALNSDTPFVFSWHRDGNIWQPYTSGGDKIYTKFAFMYGSTEHLYNKDGNAEYYVDYPVVAAILLGDQLDRSGLNYTYLPDHLAVNKGTIQIGLTEYAMQTALIGRDAGYYGYTIKDGNVVITAFDDSTLRLAKKLFEDNRADFATADGYYIPVGLELEKYGLDGFTGAFDTFTGATGAGNVAEEVKRLVTDTALCPRPQGLQLSGVVNVDSDALEYYYENVKFTDYYQYCRLLEANGFTVYMAERTAEQSFFVTYVNHSTGIMLHVMLQSYAHAAEEALAEGTTLAKMFTPTLRVIAAKTVNDKAYIHQLLDESMLRVPATGKLTQTKLTVMEVSFDLNDENKRNFGFCYVYTLEDGTFVVLDGGGGGCNSTDAERLYNLLTDLYKDTHGGSAPSSSSPIVISAWFLSHAHGDHYGMMDYFIKNYCNKKYSFSKTPVVRVDKLIANLPSNDEMYNSMDPNPTVANLLESTSWYKNNDGSYVQYYKVHTGQKFFIGNLEIEVMYTHEDIHPWSTIYFNNTSTVLRMTAHETDGNGNILVGKKAISNMNLGDLQVRGSQVLRAMWGDYLKSDMVLSSHHGGNGIEALTYYHIDAQIILWSHSANNVQSLMSETGTAAYAKQDILWLQNTRWLYIFTGQPLNETVANKYHYNPTMTLTKDGIVGLPLNVAVGDRPLTDEELQSYANQFIAGLTNEYPGSAGSSFTWGTGQFNESATAKSNYTGGTNNNGLILWRGNASYQLPDPDPVPEQKTGEDVIEDILNGDIAEF